MTIFDEYHRDYQGIEVGDRVVLTMMPEDPGTVEAFVWGGNVVVRWDDDLSRTTTHRLDMLYFADECEIPL